MCLCLPKAIKTISVVSLTSTMPHHAKSSQWCPSGHRFDLGTATVTELTYLPADVL